ncbi:MAG TPA: hypothetical protein PLC08_00475 [Candidatus Bipolaricaulis sp.]|nr:hypothetical protein [Candidatus Bipolaricaulis sp.]HRS14183.1 hypothetical protein [Candidatus Bipolaricaulis sp.]HRU21744.1 hypothetical protein [Candidatus Bipolaricaulis sp.]
MRAFRIMGIAAAVLMAFSGWAADAPLQVVFVPFDTPTLFVLATGDQDLAYTILELPTQGVLVGIPPYLTYIPRPGFSGTDWVHYLVQTDQGQWDLGTVQLVVFSPGAPMSPFVFTSEAELGWSGPTFTLNSYRFVFGVQARFAYFEQALRATWTDAGFTSFVGTTRIELEGSWPSPWRLPVTSTLEFVPTVPGLKHWTLNASTTLLGATWSSTFYFSGTDPESGTNPELDSYTTFQVQGTVGPFSFDSRVKFLTLTPTFGEYRLLVKGPWICTGCPTKWEAEYLQKKSGFDYLSFLVKDVEIPCPGCGTIQTFFDIKATFTVAEKTIEPTLRVSSGFVACVRPLVALATPATGLLSGFDLYGIEIKCELASGYTLRLATAFDPRWDSSVTGYAQFFELWQLEGPVVPCCGNPGRFQLSAYFGRESGSLFGLGMGNIILYFPVSREVLVNVGLKLGEVDPGDPTKWILTVGSKGLF